MKYSSRNSLVIIPRSTIPSDNLMKTFTAISGFTNTASTSNSSAYSSWYNVSEIKRIFDISVVTDENDSMQLNTRTCIYPLTTFLNFKRINPSWSYLLLNIHFKGTEFLSLAFTFIILIRIYAYLERTFFTSEISDISMNVRLDL